MVRKREKLGSGKGASHASLCEVREVMKVREVTMVREETKVREVREVNIREVVMGDGMLHFDLC